MTTTHTTPPADRPTRWHRFAKFFASSLIGRGWTRSGRTHRFTYRQIFVAFMVLAVAGGFIRYQIHTLDIRQSNDELVVTRQEIYNAAKVNYFDELQSHAACLETVSRSLAQRVQWGILVDAALHANLPDLATQIENGPVLSDPPRAVSDCGPAPVKPIPGPGVTP